MSQLTFGGVFGEKPKTPEVPRKESWYKGRVLSHSSVTTYQTCPQKWKFRYIDKVPELPRPYFSFGKSVHAGLEYLFSRSRDVMPTLEELLVNYKSGWISQGYETAAQEKWFYQEGERILKGYFAKHQADFKQVFQVEFKFNLDIEGVPLLGYIDRIDETPSGKLAIIDYKTGRAFDKARVRQDPQLTMYQMAVRESFGKEIESLTLYHLNSLTPLTVPAHGAALEDAVKKNVVATAQGITAEKFEARVDERGHCQYCDYIQICPAVAGKKLGTDARASGVDELKELVDRYGKLEQRLGDLNSERGLLAENLKLRMKQAGLSEVAGSHFSAQVLPSADSGDQQLSVKPTKTDS